MTPQHEDYLQELGLCLSQSIVHLLELRPQDPIEFLANSLKHHRRLYPRYRQGVELAQKQNDQCHHRVNSPDIFDSQLENTSSQQGFKPLCHVINTDDNGCDEGVENKLHFGNDYMVHYEIFSKFVTFGDLFDDDDLN